MTIVETRLQRALEHKHYAKQRGLPVVCQITGEPDQPDGVAVRVVTTGHGFARVWAKLRVNAAADAKPGRRKRVVDFTIDGQGRWPKVTLVVTVRR